MSLASRIGNAIRWVGAIEDAINEATDEHSPMLVLQKPGSSSTEVISIRQETPNGYLVHRSHTLDYFGIGDGYDEFIPKSDPRIQATYVT